MLIGAAKNLAAYFNDKFFHDPVFELEVKNEMANTFRTVLDEFADEVRAEVLAEVRAEVLTEVKRKAEQEKAESVKKLRQRHISNEEIAEILALPLEKVEQVS